MMFPQLRQDASPHRDNTKRFNCMQNELLSEKAPFQAGEEQPQKQQHKVHHDSHDNNNILAVAPQGHGELFMEEQSYRTRCISEDSDVFNLDSLLLQPTTQSQQQKHHQSRCRSTDSALSLTSPCFATHVRKVSHEQPQVPTRPVSDTSSNNGEDESSSCIPSELLSINFAAPGVVKSSPNNKRRRRSSGCLDLPEDLMAGDIGGSSSSNYNRTSKRRRMNFRNRALVGEDFDQILTQIF